MSTQPNPTSSAIDSFLSVTTKRAGKIKGEANVKGHTDDIELHGWHWGVAAPTAIGSTQASARRQYKNLVVQKGLDAASTPLLSALATNDEVKEAKLTVRKAGGAALDYYRMTLSAARVVSIELDVDSQGHPIETVSFAYGKIDIEYRPQQSSGQGGGATSFNDDVQLS